MWRAMGPPHIGQTCPRQPVSVVQRIPVGTCGDPRPALECGAVADGHERLDAQLCAYVLGQENSGVESFGGTGFSDRGRTERQVRTGWTRSQWVRRDRLGDCGEVRSSVVRAAD